MLRAVSDLAQDDLLLGRDCRRFQGLNPLPVVSTKPQKESSQRITGQLERTISLPPGYHWLHCESVGTHYYLVGHNANWTLLLLRGYWEGDGRTQVSATWDGRDAAEGAQSILLSCDMQDKMTVLIAQANRQPLPPRLLAATDDFPRPIKAETPGWLPLGSLAWGSNQEGTSACNIMGELTVYDRSGNEMIMFQLDDPGHDSTDADSPPVIHSRPRDVYVGFGTTLHCIRESGHKQTLQFPSRITGISGSRPHTRERLLVTHETGAYLLSPTVNSFKETMIEEQTTDLLGCILDDGRAVLWRPQDASCGDLLLYSASESRVVFQGATPRSSPRPPVPESPPGGIRLLLPTKTRNQVALIPHGPGSPMEMWSFPAS